MRTVIYQQFACRKSGTFLYCFIQLQSGASHARLTRSAGDLFAPHLGAVVPEKHELRYPTDILTDLVDLRLCIKLCIEVSLIC